MMESQRQDQAGPEQPQGETLTAGPCLPWIYAGLFRHPSLYQMMLTNSKSLPGQYAPLGLPDYTDLNLVNHNSFMQSHEHATSVPHNQNVVRPTATKSTLLPLLDLRSCAVMPVRPPQYENQALHQGSFIQLRKNHSGEYESPASQPEDASHSTIKRMRRHLRKGKANFDAKEGSKVVLDIAACDGPVFFERVLNKAFAGNIMEEVDSDAEINVDEVDSSDGSEHTYTTSQSKEQEGKARKAFNRSDSLSTYHCVYCNHTFKSHYCYQKHMRRHINPIMVEVGPSIKDTTDTTEYIETLNKTKQDTLSETLKTTKPILGYAVGAKLEPKLVVPTLDLNVQYFPCKTCGSKFPSYYFVHKHRRLCHGETSSREQEAFDHEGGLDPKNTDPANIFQITEMNKNISATENENPNNESTGQPLHNLENNNQSDQVGENPLNLTI